MSEVSQKMHLKPYDYKIGNLDNDGCKVIKIYTKAPEYIIYRTDSAIRIDLDDESPKIAEYAANHYKIVGRSSQNIFLVTRKTIRL